MARPRILRFEDEVEGHGAKLELARECGLELGETGAIKVDEGMGTLSLKAFDCNVARTGLTVKQAREVGFDPVSIIVSGPDKPEFMPQARPPLVELVADGERGHILGAQCVGLGMLTSA